MHSSLQNNSRERKRAQNTNIQFPDFPVSLPLDHPWSLAILYNCSHYYLPMAGNMAPQEVKFLLHVKSENSKMSRAREAVKLAGLATQLRGNCQLRLATASAVQVSTRAVLVMTSAV